MFSYSKAAMERAMKVQEVILRTMAKKITWLAGGRKNGGATGRGKDAGGKVTTIEMSPNLWVSTGGQIGKDSDER
jgi:hypothetical protein